MIGDQITDAASTKVEQLIKTQESTSSTSSFPSDDHVLHTKRDIIHDSPHHRQRTRSFKETLISWLPTDSNTFLFEIVVMTYLIIGVVHFSHTGDTSMLTTLLECVAAYVGVKQITPLIPKSRKENDNPKPPEAK